MTLMQDQELDPKRRMTYEEAQKVRNGIRADASIMGMFPGLIVTITELTPEMASLRLRAYGTSEEKIRPIVQNFAAETLGREVGENEMSVEILKPPHQRSL